LALVYRKTIEEHRGMQKRVLHEPIKCLKMLLVQQVIHSYYYCPVTGSSASIKY